LHGLARPPNAQRRVGKSIKKRGAVKVGDTAGAWVLQVALLLKLDHTENGGATTADI
jgi:hypothetical protein